MSLRIAHVIVAPAMARPARLLLVAVAIAALLSAPRFADAAKPKASPPPKSKVSRLERRNAYRA